MGKSIPDMKYETEVKALALKKQGKPVATIAALVGSTVAKLEPLVKSNVVLVHTEVPKPVTEVPAAVTVNDPRTES